MSVKKLKVGFLLAGLVSLGYVAYEKFVNIDVNEVVVVDSELNVNVIDSPMSQLKESSKQDSSSNIHSNLASEEIERVLNGENKKNEENLFDKIKEIFPELKDQVDQYQFAIEEQSKLVDAYRKKVLERNEFIKEGGNSAGMDLELEYEKEALLASAKELGKEAVIINEAIREQAENMKSYN